MRVGLVGCVKTKRTERAAAKDLYTSPLFRGRVRFVEQTCDRWFILSARHGLVAPDEVLEPYDETLNAASPSARREWSRQVLRDLGLALGDLNGVVFEVHAGSSYLGNGLVRGLTRLGGEVVNPIEGLRMGEQLAYYRDQPGG